ncbi:GlxA family transcriptional regulator [Nocardia goodfellowii]|uniref:Transcriptional regulator GlxA family with amidase domain n=1 Tax=Nocardia goodfellowii TaxID=882446 RepID=A0ABS4QE21_9NOCA|nr:GlxA family transcriptional regulator [Nocardia goodfellowii]MBP2189354.1 transcriptional regulator GlxA family with amidase domain [Nocardia goodfellowii]
MNEALVVVVGYHGVELLDIACVTSSLDMANRMGAAPRYRMVVVTPGGAPVECNSGLSLPGQEALEQFNQTIDTLVVSGGLGHCDAAADAKIVGHVRRLARQSRRVASICTGATVLAATGLLDGKSVTTHWFYADELAKSYPKAQVDPNPIFVRDGNVATSGGVTSALDLTLAFIEEDHGAEVARRVAMGLVTYLRRPGSQSQVSTFVASPPPEHPLVRRVVEYIGAHLDGDLDGPALSAVAGTSDRHLTRLFVQEIGETPGKYVRRIRADTAARLLRSTGLRLDEIAGHCGYSSAETLRQAFTARFGQSPSAYRTAHRRQDGTAVSAR